MFVDASSPFYSPSHLFLLLFTYAQYSYCTVLYVVNQLKVEYITDLARVLCSNFFSLLSCSKSQQVCRFSPSLDTSGFFFCFSIPWSLSKIDHSPSYQLWRKEEKGRKIRIECRLSIDEARARVCAWSPPPPLPPSSRVVTFPESDRELKERRKRRRS